ncbi:MAG: COX aromatic rich motif-containing protein [Parachlamydiaceae bacterium]|nr:COX aromatic rich motif-containing protein [Parachlamydiaceae bacterium]
MKTKFFLGIIAIIVAVIGIVFVLSSENALVVHPKGIIANKELELIITNILLMLVIIIPTYILLFTIVWKYCIKNNPSNHDPHYTSSSKIQLMMWGLPTLIVIAMAIVTWKATHDLNPYKPIESDEKPLTIQVIAMDWKWLFIYPEQGIASLNELHIPERTPIHLQLTADGSPMNSFWIPQLSGQIYSMTGMSTQLHIMANGPGEYVGKAVEINGEGYADMTFLAKSTTIDEFNQWISKAKNSSHPLTEEAYKELVKHSINKSIILFSEVEKDLYPKVVHQYMYPTQPVL